MPALLQKAASNFFLLLLLLGFTGSFAQSLNLKDFEKLPTVKSPKEYLAKKDFVVKQDSSSGDYLRLKLVNRATKEMIYVTCVKGIKEDTLFEVEYFTETQEEYGKIVRTINKNGYNAVGDNRHYEKHETSYETERLILKELVAVKERDYYSIYYSCYITKRVAVTVAPTKQVGIDFFK